MLRWSPTNKVPNKKEVYVLKKFIAGMIALLFALAAFAGPASATGGGGKAEVKGKDITICHSGSGKNYTKITIDINGWLGSGNGNSGHKSHDDDIWEAFTYYERTGPDTYKTVNVPAQGDTSLLAFEDCKAPKQPEKVTVAVNILDKCATKDDSVTATISNPAVGNVQVDRKTPTTWEVVAVLNNKTDFVFDLDNTWNVNPDGSRATKVVTLTDEDCDLPETGGAAEYSVNIGIAAVVGVLLLVGAFYLLRRKKS